MAVDFDSPEFKKLYKEEKKRIVIEEFSKCIENFSYFLHNYAVIRHPNAGLIKMKPFEFQLDVALPVAQTLLTRRSKETWNALKTMKFKFDYQKWWKNIAEEHIELSKKVPPEFHNYHKVTKLHEDFCKRVDTILLKSRQTGLSTIFQLLVLWHINFHSNISDLVLSQSDREAKKFLSGVITSYGLIPSPLKSKRLNSNAHDLWVSLNGNKSMRSGLSALPPTPDSGRSYDPNLIVLDEFAMYKKAEELWAAITLSASAGGVIVIISTPRGVGNLYHKIWEITNKSLSVTLRLPKTTIEAEEQSLSVFRPMVVHWSQLPHEEFTRRGFTDALGWYNHMKAKISMENGEKAVGQELDLDFTTSGNTINPNIIKVLRQQCLENIENKTPKILDSVIPGLIVYEPPIPGVEYIMGVDTSEGIYQDYSVLHMFKLPDRDVGGLPTCVAKWASNSQSIRQFKDIVKDTGNLYNEAWVNIERNNHGHVLLSYFIDDSDYNENKIFNKYNAIKGVFIKSVKGWHSSAPTRRLLISILTDFLSTYQQHLQLPLDTIDELKTFVQDSRGRWDALTGYYDDHILSCGLAILGWKFIDKFKQFLIDSKGDSEVETDIPNDMMLMSSSLLHPTLDKEKFIEEQTKSVHSQENPLLRKQTDIEELRAKFKNAAKDSDLEEKRPKTLRKIPQKQQYLSVVRDLGDDDDDTITF